MWLKHLDHVHGAFGALRTQWSTWGSWIMWQRNVSSEKGIDRLTKERIKSQRNRSYRKGFREYERGLEHLGLIWSNMGALLCHMLKGWAKKDVVAPGAFLLCHYTPSYTRRGSSCSMRIPLALWDTPIEPWSMILHHAWPCCEMYVSVVPKWCCCSNIDVLMPHLKPVTPSIHLLHHHGASWTILVFDDPSMLWSPLRCSRSFKDAQKLVLLKVYTMLCHHDGC